MKTASGCLAGAQQMAQGQVGHAENPYLTGGPFLMQANEIQQAVMMIHNCSPTSVKLEINEIIGWLKNITDCEVEELNPEYLKKMSAVYEVKREQAKTPLTKKERTFITLNLRCGDSVPPEVHRQYLDLVLKHHMVVCEHRFDLGLTNRYSTPLS